MKQYKWAFEWMGKAKYRLILAIFFNIAGVGLMTWEPYIFKDIVDDILMPQQFERLFPMLGLSVLVGLAFSACRYLTSILAEQAAESAVVNLKGALFRKLMALGPDYYREKGYETNRPSIQKRYLLFTEFILQAFCIRSTLCSGLYTDGKSLKVFKSGNIRIDSENSEMITSFTIFCLVINFRASDFNLSDREITLEIGRIILSIPQTEFYITIEIK